MFQKLFGTNHRSKMNQQIQDVSIYFKGKKKVLRLFCQLQGDFNASPRFFLNTPWTFHSSPLKFYHLKIKVVFQLSGWWFQPISKIWVNMGIFPK